MSFKYLFKGVSHTDTTTDYMQNLGMNSEQIESVLSQFEFEKAQVYKYRQDAYRAEADHLFIEWKYDGTEEKEAIWRDKVQEIKNRFPLYD